MERVMGFFRFIGRFTGIVGETKLCCTHRDT